MNLLKELYNDVKAYFRGDARIQPRGQTGRIYKKKKGQPGVGEMFTKGKLAVKARIIRADGTIEELGEL